MVTLGDGSQVNIKGRATLHVKLGAYNGKVGFHVLGLDSNMDAILGQEWLNQHNAVIDFGTK